MRRFSVLLVLALLPLPAEAATVLTACGQTVAAGAELAGTLDCTGFPTAAVIVENGTLDLKGFSLIGGNDDAIRCNGGCEVISTGGVGHVQGAGGYGIHGLGPTLTARNLDVHDNVTGIAGSSLDISDVASHDNAVAGISCTEGSLRVQNSVVSDNGAGGIYGCYAKNNLVNVDVVGNAASGFFGLVLEARDSDFSGNRVGIKQETFNPCGPTPGDGPCPKRMRISNCTVNDNVESGIESVAGVYLLDSTVSGNGTAGVIDAGHWTKYLQDRPQTYPCASSNVRGSSIVNNGGVGFYSGGRTIKVEESDVSNNTGNGIVGVFYCARRLRVSESTVNGNGLHGVAGAMDEGATVGVSDSVVTGNGTDAACGSSQTCADVASNFQPKLRDATCGSSYASLSGFPGTTWGVCSAD